MARDCLRAASIGAVKNRSRDAAPPIPPLDAALSMFYTEKETLNRVLKGNDLNPFRIRLVNEAAAGAAAQKCISIETLKYLFTAALVALLLWLLYRRLRPYIQMLRQVLRAFTGALDATSESQSGLGQRGETSASKLVRCASCSTWIPMNRALHANSSSYCSQVCLRKAPKVKGRKTAG